MAGRCCGKECKGKFETGLGFGKVCMKVINEAVREESEHCLTGLRTEQSFKGVRFRFNGGESSQVEKWLEKLSVSSFRLI